jgi:hypothetical protein
MVWSQLPDMSDGGWAHTGAECQADSSRTPRISSIWRWVRGPSASDVAMMRLAGGSNIGAPSAPSMCSVARNPTQVSHFDQVCQPGAGSLVPADGKPPRYWV